MAEPWPPPGVEMRNMDYMRFLGQKLRLTQGHQIAHNGLSPVLFPFQRDIVAWALRKGRAAMFCDTGLGKTLMQLEWARHVEGRVLILAPLAVAGQTVREAQKLNMEVAYCRRDEGARVTITNYEMLRAFSPGEFQGVVLDESSILKSFDGKTRTTLIEVFQGTPYRLCCTATPAPNDLEEFGNHAEFLGICTRRDMLATYFVHRDDGWHIKGHAREAFYRWLASWAMMVKTPSDIGHDDNGYLLPPLEVKAEWVDCEIKTSQGRMFPGALGGIRGRAQIRKVTVANKATRIAEIVNSDSEQWLIWCGLNNEAEGVTRLIPDAVNVQGSDSVEHKEQSLRDFADGKLRVLVTKQRIAGFGMNFQMCHNMAFVGLTDSFESYYQAIRRCWRFGQQHPVEVRIVLSNEEAPILDNVLQKEAVAEQTSNWMVKNMAQYEREELQGSEVRVDYAEDIVRGEGWKMLRGDCIEWLQKIDPQSVDFSVFSPPFLSLYSYSASDRDMGNSKSDAEFMRHFSYFLAGLRRVMKPGRIVACHVAQVPTTLVDDGVIGLTDFRGMTIESFKQAGFIHHGEVCIDKDPQAQAIRTHSKGLLFVQLHKDASWVRPAIPDYILLFRQQGDNAVPVHPDINNDEWIEWARPIWYGLRESDTLNVAEARSEKDEKHIAPLQLGTIERCLRLWSNPGELVLSPFAGIGSEGYEAIRLGRKFVGIELKREYAEVACRNLNRAVYLTKQGRLL